MSEPVYRSQWDPDGSSRRNDCGPACCAMVLDGLGQHVAINDISAQIMPGQDVGTDAGDLVKALRDRGVNAQAWAGLTYPPAPYIALVNYAGFDRANVQDVNFRGWHWLIVLSMNDLTVVCHDPDYSGARRAEGDHKRYGRAEFDAAFIRYGQAKIAVVWEDKTVTTTPTAGIVASDADFLRVRAAPNSPTITGYLANGSAVSIIGQANDSLGRPWYQIKRTATYPFTFTDEAMTKTMAAEFTGWSYAALIKVDQPPVVTPPAQTKPAGVGIHALSNIRAVQVAQAAGCEVFTIMDKSLEAAQYATGDPRKWYPGCGYPLVFYRQYHQPNPWSPADMEAQLGGIMAQNNPNVVITFGNEWDIGIPGAGDSVAGMTRFCDWTIDVVGRLTKRGFRNLAWLTSSMGTPDFTRQDVCDVIKAKIAPLVNSGVIGWTDMHLYSPNKTWIYKGLPGYGLLANARLVLGRVGRDDHQVAYETDVPAGKDAWLYTPLIAALTTDNPTAQDWFETRWHFLYTRCGFDPKSDHRIISTECGVDEGGVGGFPAHKMSNEEVVTYTRRFVELQSAQIVVNGQSYPSPFMAGTYFQGDPTSAQWSGYRVDGYYDALKAARWGQA